jgi:hypothetical protein
MRIDIHPKAAENFNNRADDLIDKLISNPYANRPRKNILNADAVIRDVIIDESSSRISYSDYKGEVARVFDTPQGEIGLFEGGYKELESLAESIYKIRELRNKISLVAIRDIIFSWVEGMYKEILHETLTDYLQDQLTARVKDLEVCIPIYKLQIPREIILGKVVLRTLTKRLLDPWYEAVLSVSDPDKLDANRFHIEQQREELQGYAAACVKLTAEPSKASEIAFDLAEKAVALLRFFTPANRTVHITSCTSLFGRQYREGNVQFILTDGMVTSYSENDVDHNLALWIISAEDLIEFESMGLLALDELLNADPPSEFQEVLLASLLLYSQCTLKTALADKLIQILVAIEALLLKDNNEPINKTIGERMAFLFRVWTAEERQKLVSTVARVYNIRSAFIHHGKSVEREEIEVIEEFMVYVWLVFQSLTVNHTKYKTRQDLFKELDSRKFA